MWTELISVSLPAYPTAADKTLFFLFVSNLRNALSKSPTWYLEITKFILLAFVSTSDAVFAFYTDAEQILRGSLTHGSGFVAFIDELQRKTQEQNCKQLIFLCRAVAKL